MNILYCGISSKYIHTMPAGWFLCEYLKSKGIQAKENYYNVNQPFNTILADIIHKKPDVLLLSVYIFNVNVVTKLIKEAKNLLSDCKIIVGGPEVDENFDADHIIIGEGEKAIYELLKNGGDKINYEQCFRNLDDIPSPYTDERLLQSKNKLVYYESSRGCPFRCSYCMASLSNGVRYFSIDRVKADLMTIVKSGAKIIKFTDRTFNANIARTNEILNYILKNFYNKKICFHFEVGGDLFTPSTLEILKKMPLGLIQMEAGVQTLNPHSLKAINRVFEKQKFINNITAILGYNNIHMHLDLIAGLPYDNIKTFIQSFNDVIRLRPHNLQLGFLKFLKGAPIRVSYKAEFSNSAPYEISSSPNMSNRDLKLLKKVEFVLNRLYNSGKFHYTINYLLDACDNAFDMFKDISDYFDNKRITNGVYESTLYNALTEYLKDLPFAKDYLRFDYLITNNSKKLPYNLKSQHTEEFKKFLAQNKHTRFIMHQNFNYLPFKQDKGNYIVRFDYSFRNPVDMQYLYQLL